jgi:4-hydroxybenzoate polyprenyltransferase
MVSAFLKLIRLKNLLIIALTQSVLKYFLIEVYFTEPSLTYFSFSFYLIALILVVAAGYIVNDIYDVEIDKINKYETRVIEKTIKKSAAFKVYYFFNFLGLFCGFYAAFIVNKIWLGFIFLFFILSLWRYSQKHKTSFIIGNIQVAFLTALSIINLGLFELLSTGLNIKEESHMIFLIIMFYAGFSFITTLIREIIKDLEDIEGDKNISADTLAIKFGVKKTNYILLILNSILILAITCFQYYQYSVLNSTFSVELSYWGANKIAVIYTLILQLLIVFQGYRIYQSKTKKDFHFLSMLSKIIMLVGILSIPVFTLLHQN